MNLARSRAASLPPSIRPSSVVSSTTGTGACGAGAG